MRVLVLCAELYGKRQAIVLDYPNKEVLERIKAIFITLSKCFDVEICPHPENTDLFKSYFEKELVEVKFSQYQDVMYFDAVFVDSFVTSAARNLVSKKIPMIALESARYFSEVSPLLKEELFQRCELISGNFFDFGANDLLKVIGRAKKKSKGQNYLRLRQIFPEVKG